MTRRSPSPQDAAFVLALFQRSRRNQLFETRGIPWQAAPEMRLLAAVAYVETQPRPSNYGAYLTQFLESEGGLEDEVSENYREMIEAHCLFTRVVVASIAGMKPCPCCAARSARLADMCRLLQGQDLGIVSNVDAAKLIISHWCDPKPRLNTVRDYIKELRLFISYAADWYGFANPDLCVQVRSHSRRRSRSRPLRDAIAYFDETAPILTLYPWLLLQVIDHLLVTLYWHHRRPFGVDGSMAPALTQTLRDRYAAFEARAPQLANRLGFVGIDHSELVRHMTDIFLGCMAVKLPFLGDADQCEARIKVEHTHQELLERLGRSMIDVEDMILPDSMDRGIPTLISRYHRLWAGVCLDITLGSGCNC